MLDVKQVDTLLVSLFEKLYMHLIVNCHETKKKTNKQKQKQVGHRVNDLLIKTIF